MSKKQNVPFFESYNLLATWFGVGNIKYAPGTFGSLAALPIWLLIDSIFRNVYVPVFAQTLIWVILLSLLFFVGVFAADIYSKKTKSKDSSKIVIDEVLGQLLTIVLSYPFVIGYIYTNKGVVIYLIGCFVLFRIFDISKVFLAI